MKRIVALLLACSALGMFSAGAEERETPETALSIIEEAVVNYGAYGDAARQQNDALMAKARALDAGLAGKWERIMELWKTVRQGVEIHRDILPDDLNDTDALCLVVLGFQLNPDGSMKDELIERLKVAKACTQKYPHALIVCTGGGTAADNPSATEAGKMGEWLVENGVSAHRVIVEDQSLTTAQNAMYTYQILKEKHPQVREIAIISSDYHIATGALLFGAEAILLSEEAGQEDYAIVSNAAYAAPSGSLSSMFQAGALIELAGDVKTAFEIYYDTYTIHELPAIHE